MKVEIRKTVAEEAEALALIQKAAFAPLYEKYHDGGNPFLRGPEDILRRLNKNNRHYTILCDDKMVGGIFYRCKGKRNPLAVIKEGEYYLARVYIHPDYQNQGIARQAILLCEKEFPDAESYFVDFPEDLDKNRRCYESAGYCDTGERLYEEGAPALAVYKKTVKEKTSPEDVKLPFIFEIDSDELESSLDVIHRSFQTVAEEFGLTKENCPRHTSFLPLNILKTHKERGWYMYGLYAGKTQIGYMSLSEEEENIYELHNLAILPEYRRNGFGKLLLDFAKETVHSLGGKGIKVGIIEENIVLKNWYIKNGFVHIGTRKFEHLPFTSGYLEWREEG